MTEQLKTVLDVAAALGCAELPAVDTADGAERVANKEKNTTFLLSLARELGLIDGPANSDKSRINDVYFLLDLARGLDLIGGETQDSERENGVRFLHDIAESMDLISTGLYTHLGPEVSQAQYKKYDLNFILDLSVELGVIDSYRIIEDDCGRYRKIETILENGFKNVTVTIPELSDKLSMVENYVRAVRVTQPRRVAEIEEY